MTLQKTIHNVITGEIITRDYNETELAEAEADQAQAKKEATAKANTDVGDAAQFLDGVSFGTMPSRRWRSNWKLASDAASKIHRSRFQA